MSNLILEFNSAIFLKIILSLNDSRDDLQRPPLRSAGDERRQIDPVGVIRSSGGRRAASGSTGKPNQ